MGVESKAALEGMGGAGGISDFFLVITEMSESEAFQLDVVVALGEGDCGEVAGQGGFFAIDARFVIGELQRGDIHLRGSNDWIIGVLGG